MAEKVEDLNLPASVVTRIIKECLPDNVNVSKEARVAVARAASVFVLYITSASNNIAIQSHRKTISGNDVLKALAETDFELFVSHLKESLDAHKKVLQDKKEQKASEKSAEKAEINGEANGKLNNSATMEADEEEVQEVD